MMGFSRRLRELRESKGFSQEGLADILEIPRSSITHYENSDDRTPRRERLEKIASFFNVSIDYLLGRTDEPVSPDREDHLTPEEEKLWEEIKHRTTTEAEQLFFYKFSMKSAADKRRIMRLIEAMDEADAED